MRVQKLEITKLYMISVLQLLKSWEYKNNKVYHTWQNKFYSYLNLESTKTVGVFTGDWDLVLQLLKSWEYKNSCWKSQKSSNVLQLLKSWEYKNLKPYQPLLLGVLQLLKSWEYKNYEDVINFSRLVLQLLKSWEYKNS